MVVRDNWTSKYLHSDHHTDRFVRTALSLENHYGIRFQEICPPKLRPTAKMARGRGYGAPNADVVQVTTRRKGLDYDDFEPMSTSRRVSHITSTTNEDLDNIKSRSRRTDQALLSDISNKLLRMDFERVKPSTEVALVTGFRRPLYSKGFPPVEKETRRQRRKDELRYPWDNTRDNFYRYKPKSKKKTSKGVFIANEYPEYDPLGLYMPRRRKSVDSASDSKILPGQNTEFLLAKLRAKMRSLPHGSVDESRNAYLDTLCTPVPKRIAKYEPVKMESYSDTSVSREPFVNRKVQDSKGIIADFEAELESRAHRSRDTRRLGLGAAARAHSMVDFCRGRDDTEAHADFTEPVRMRRSSISGARRIVVVPTSSPTLRHFRQSTPPPPRVVTVNAAGAGGRGRRATSVPPMPTQTRVIHDEELVFPSYRPPPRRVPLYSYIPTRPVAHTTARPMASRRAGSEPPRDSHRALQNARHSLKRLEAEIGVRDPEPYFTPVVVPARKHVYRAASVPRSVGVVAPSRPPTGMARRPYLVTRSVVIPRSPSPVRQRLLIDVEDSYVPPARPIHLPASLSSLRHKTVEARNKLDEARTLYDRYLPVPSGAPADVQSEVDYKYGELAARIPSLERHSGKRSYFGSAGPVTPYKPAPAPPRGGQPDYMTSGLRHPPPRPKVSQVRRNARNVLCRTKGDPNYYTY